MIILLSPAKSLNFELACDHIKSTQPAFLDDSKKLIASLKKLSASDLMQLMQISEKLAKLNHQRFQDFQIPFNSKNSKPALFVFDGDVYDGIDVENYKKSQLEFAQQHLRILSGLYGVLRPLDLMQAYRLEMGTVFANSRGKNLYQFWQEKITNYLNCELEKSADKIILNLASEEYFKAVEVAKIKGEIINVVFKEKKDLQYKIVGIFAKKARGLMADFIIKNEIGDVGEIKKFNAEGYKFSEKMSDGKSWCFCR